jgi:hypothetical protein
VTLALGVLVAATLFGEMVGAPALVVLGGEFLGAGGVVALDPHISTATALSSPHRWLPLGALGLGAVFFGLMEWLEVRWAS